MSDRYMQLPSKAMGRNIHLWCYGHFGVPIVIFPSAAGFAHEWQQQGMIEVLRPLLQRGKIKLYCPESNVAEAWTRKEGSLEERMHKHHLYERFILEDLRSFIAQDCYLTDPVLQTAGCSLGATYAANFALKFPHIFRHAICMSGRYLTTELTDGENSSSLYFNNPLAYVTNLSGEALAHVQKTQLTLICGKGAYEEGCIEETIALAKLLKRKSIPCHSDIWGKDSRHDWGWWKRQVKMYFFHYFG